MSLSEILFDTLKDDEQKVRRLIKANFKIWSGNVFVSQSWYMQ